MSKVKLNPQIELDVDEILDGIAQLHDSEFEPFAEKVMAQRVRRRAAVLPQDEADLLEQINRGLPVEVWQRYELLNAKAHDEELTDEERKELLAIIDRIELTDAERLHHLIALSHLRSVSVDELVEQLGIRRHNYG